MICDIDFEKITTCIFDVNGVLIDSNRANALAMSRAFDAEGEMRERIVKLYLQLTGVDRGTKIRMVQERIIGKPFEEGEFDSRWEKVKALAHGAMSEAPLIPGCREVLEALGRRGRSRIALSNTPEAELREVLAANGLDKFLDVIRGGGDWPKTESLARLLREYELDPRECIFFGDGKGDLEAAGHADVAFFGIDPGTGEFEGEKNLCGVLENLAEWGRNIGLL
ncbi:MAG: HAD family hydrolase [Desulfobacteraceae bacterium]|nr:HAD family hydrolase [Desulfobacteraceae bacterium]